MSLLAPKLFDRRYDDLIQIGRSRLPAFAPEWTDHNAHDPGITLMELLAWIAEAQLYSLGHVSRDERIAYAALFGVAPNGNRPARGLIWPDRSDPSSPAATFAGSRVIDTDAVVRPERHDAPVLHPQWKTLWVPGRVSRLWTRLADGTVRDLTASNGRGTALPPFGERAGPHDLLTLEFETRGDEGLFPARREDADGARWIIGVRAADGAGATDDAASPTAIESPIVSVSLVTGAERYPLPVLHDSSAGLLRTGALVLDVSQIAASPKRFRIEIHAPHGFVRPPRLLRIEPNALPVTDRRRIERELHVANGQPDFGFELDGPGLCFEPAVEPLHVEVRTDAEFEDWRRCDRLSERGPDDRVYELDTAQSRLLFGNGYNGRKPGAGAQIYVSYWVSGGDEANVARNRRWTVAGFTGVFGVNPDPIAGGSGRSDWTSLRRQARRNAREDHALVSAADIEAAALALPLLEVARAWVLAPRPKGPQSGAVTLVAMRARPAGVEPEEAPESPRWLEAVRRRLAGRMPLGTRLVVTAPRYVEFFVRVQVEVEPGLDPADVESAVKAALRDRLALVKSRATPQPRAPGIAVTQADVGAWILGVPGVRRIARLELVAGRTPEKKVAVPRGALPRLDLVRSAIRATRPAPGSRQ